LKKILILFVPLILFFGCEVFENNLNENLFGTWKRANIYMNEDLSSSHILGYSFNDNNNYTTYYSSIDNDINGAVWEFEGEWWVDGDILWMENNNGETSSQQYSVSNDSLMLYMQNPQIILIDTDDDGVGDDWLLAQDTPPYYRLYLKE
tara:strand:- start:968 stop:1414 length:447 start_codon:yes stop_codon:yes gene_type:complete